MQGYFVITKAPTTDEELRLIDSLRKTEIIDLHSTRSFNQVTRGVFKPSTKAAVTRIRNSTPDAKEKRKQYYSRPETKARIREYNKSPEAKERKRKANRIKARLLAAVPAETVQAIYAEEQRKLAEAKVKEQ